LNWITALQNLYRQFPEKHGNIASFYKIEKILQKQLDLTRAVFVLRYDQVLKTPQGKSPFNGHQQKIIVNRLNRSLKPWIPEKKVGFGWLGFWPVVTGRYWTGCFALGFKRCPGDLSVEEKKLMELLADLTSFYLEERRLWEILERADRQASLGFMSPAVIHEIRGPLTALSTIVQMMPEKKNDETFVKSTQPLMLHQINRISGMADSFFSLDHLGAKRKTRVEFFQVVDQVVRLLSPLFEMKRVQLKVKNSAGLFLKGNESQLESLLLNLLQNALESSHSDGKVEISTALLAHKNEQGSWIKLTVKDNGTGIPKECLKKMFDSYFSTKGRGTGLGLAICQRVIENHQGKLKTTSSKRGTVIQIFLPGSRKVLAE
jgi:signal transduction histidine kinase